VYEQIRNGAPPKSLGTSFNISHQLSNTQNEFFNLWTDADGVHNIIYNAVEQQWQAKVDFSTHAASSPLNVASNNKIVNVWQVGQTFYSNYLTDNGWSEASAITQLAGAYYPALNANQDIFALTWRENIADGQLIKALRTTDLSWTDENIKTLSQRLPVDSNIQVSHFNQGFKTIWVAPNLNDASFPR